MILAIDQGTTGTTCLVVDDELRVRGRGYRGLRQHFPQPGWVEHDPEEIWATVVGAAGDLAAIRAGIRHGATYEPSADQASLTERRADWRAAVRRALLN